MIKPLERFLTDSKDLLCTPKCDNSVKRMAALYAIIALLGASIGIPFSYDIVYYCTIILSLGFLIFKGGFMLSTPFIALYIVILINILIVDIPPFFKPMQRAVLFLLLTLTCTSAMDTKVALEFRAYLFRYIIYGVIIIGVGSFFCYFAGINLMGNRWGEDNDFERYSNLGGSFGGLAAHSMMLGPIAMISALFFYFLYQKRTEKIYLMLFFFSAMSVVLSASRAAILSLFIAVVYNLIFGKVNTIVRERMIGVIVISAMLTIPIYGVVFKGVINKQEIREKNGTVNSREDKMSFRINEFNSSPLLGVGFCAIDINGGDRYTESEGRIEPGTSHLAVLSMLGLAGFAVYIVIIYLAYSRAKRVNSRHSRFVLACFIAFFVHAWFEGYILSAGGFLALMFWLIVGQCIDSPRIYKIHTRQSQIYKK